METVSQEAPKKRGRKKQEETVETSAVETPVETSNIQDTEVEETTVQPESEAPVVTDSDPVVSEPAVKALETSVEEVEGVVLEDKKEIARKAVAIQCKCPASMVRDVASNEKGHSFSFKANTFVVLNKPDYESTSSKSWMVPVPTGKTGNKVSQYVYLVD